MPADALVYLETKDLGKAVGIITNNPKLKASLAQPPDTSLLDGMEMAISVTGFETTEEQLNEENSVLNFQPRFVAAIETRLWNFQVISFVEEHLGLFISEMYGGEATLETSDKYGGKYFVWSGRNGRKAYGLVVGSLILFGNDESALERCISVKNGNEESILKAQRVPELDGHAVGQISPEGIAQIANLASISLAKRASDEADVQSVVARILPEILRGSVKDVTWVTRATETGVEDTYDISLQPELIKVFRETIVPSKTAPDRNLSSRVAGLGESITRYDLRDPQIAWRSILLSAPTVTDQVGSGLINAFASSLFEPYGIDDPEVFLGSVGSVIHTFKLDAAGEKLIVLAAIKDPAKLKLSLAKELGFQQPPERIEEAESWLSVDKDLRAIISSSNLLIGDPEGTLDLLRRLNSQAGEEQVPYFEPFISSKALAATISADRTTAANIVEVIGEKKEGSPEIVSYSYIETRVGQKGVERRTISDFGLIGTIISMLAPEK